MITTLIAAALAAAAPAPAQPDDAHGQQGQHHPAGHAGKDCCEHMKDAATMDCCKGMADPAAAKHCCKDHHGDPAAGQ